MSWNAERALQLLRIGSGQPGAVFREGQEDAIRHIVEGQGRLLVVQKTGWGKSFVYFIAAQLLREAGMGPALLVSPLLSLMRNQLAAAARMGVRAATINSDNQRDWKKIEGSLAQNELDILLISPERLANEHFTSEVLTHIADNLSLLVVDEAHCISDWGHDFRPHYRLLERIVRGLPSSLRVLATTATANNRVMADLQSVLGPNLRISRGALQRSSLTLQTIALPSQAERLAWLAQYIPTLPGCGIVYALTVRDAELVSAWLVSRGIVAPAYTGQSDGRAELEQALLDNQLKALVATTALGMGFDKPDLAFVVHYQSPGSVVAYYQQVGRAGRALDSAYGVLLSGQEETEVVDFFIQSAFPSRDEVDQLLAALAASRSGLSLAALMGKVNLSWDRIDRALALLSLESPPPLLKEGPKWQLTGASLEESFWERAARLTGLRKAEQTQMQAYVRLETEHMQYLVHALDGDPSQVRPATLPPLPVLVNPELVQDALAFLRRTDVPIAPRKRWPEGGLPKYGARGHISAARQAQEGKALCMWGDAGWGATVREGKSNTGRFDDELVAACVDLVRRWAPEPAPTWLCCIPSLTEPSLMPDFAQRLADALRLPFCAALRRTEARPSQRTMTNSAQQARNLDGAFELTVEALPKGPVLLLDGVVNSRWTFTIASWLLLKSDSGPVWPLALAKRGGAE